MREVSTVVLAPARVAFGLLEDPKSFERLVAGARRIRRFDPRWPDEGSMIHHTIGLPPLVIRDTTRVLAMREPDFVRLEARVGPLGALLVEFEFTAAAGGCRVVVREQPRSGFLCRPGVRQLAQMTVTLRNVGICRRYRKMVAERLAAAGVSTGG